MYQIALSSDTSSLTASPILMYSASHIKNTMVRIFVLLQEIASVYYLTIEPKVVLIFPFIELIRKLAFENADNSIPFRSDQMPLSIVPIR